MRSLVLAFLLLAFVAAPVVAQETEIASKEQGASAEVVLTGLEAPVDIAFGPDGTLYYASFMSGELRAVAPGGSGPGEVLWTAPDLQGGGERGFVGLALAPDFASSRAFYVNYQHNGSTGIVTRLSKVVDGQETVLLVVDQPGLLHNSGRIAFHPDGSLFMSVGDGIVDTAARAKSAHAQDPADLRGKILRLTADGAPAPGNPWGGAAWTKGHRNVYGLAISPDGVVLGTENGPDKWDEINVLEAGQDYGWPQCTGVCGRGEFADPVLAYESTIAPTGAVWFKGHFYFTDFNKGSVHRVYERANGTWADERVLKFTTPRILDVAAFGDALYVSTWDSVWTVTPGVVGSAPVVQEPPTPEPTPETTTPAPSAPPAEESADGAGAVGEASKGIPLPGALLALVALAGVSWSRRA